MSPPLHQDPIPFEPNERIFTLSDVRKLFLRLRTRLLLIAIAASLGFFALTLLTPPVYIAEATFKEGVEKSDEGGLKDFLTGFGMSSQQPQTLVLMKSHQVLKPLLVRYGLQLSVPRGGFFHKVTRRIRDNWSAEQEVPLQDVDWFAFEDVHYEGELKTTYALRFTDPEQFELLSEQNELLAHGTRGSLLQHQNIAFTCTQVPSNLQLGAVYPLTFTPWIDTLKNLKGKLKIASHKTNKSIYDLTMEHRDRHLAARLLNSLMEEYRNYLAQERDLIAAEQLAYLEQKQTQIYAQLAQVFDEHTEYLKGIVSAKGFVGLKEELESYVQPHEAMRAKILSIEVALALLEKREQWEFVASHEPFAEKMHSTTQMIQTLEHQRDLFELALQSKIEAPDMQQQFSELGALRQNKIDAERLHHTLKTVTAWQNVEFPAPFAWARGSSSLIEQTDFSAYLANHLRLLSVREKMLQERFAHACTSPTSELQGIELEAAQKLHLEATRKLDEAESAMHHLRRLRAEMESEDFELGALSVGVKDPFSLEIIAKASALAMKLKDEKYRTDKEADRWIVELRFFRKVLHDHLEQLCKVEELNANLLRKKITDLQRLSLDSIHQKLSILQTHLSDMVQQKKAALQGEKTLLQEKMAELRTLAADLPERWKLENWLEIKTEMGAKIMQVMTELIESKTISRHLHHVESKPLDRAVTPILAASPHLFRMALLGALFAAAALFFFVLIRTLLRGFPISLEKLDALRYPVSGPLKAGLQTLQRLTFFLGHPTRSAIVALIGGDGPNYSHLLSEHLAGTDQRALVVDLPENFQSKRFAAFLEEKRAAYDQILIWAPVPLKSTASLNLLALADKAIVTVSEETTEQLTPFIHWAYHEKECRLTFVGSE